MATPYWLGTATAVAQVTTVQITAFDAATTYILTIGTSPRTTTIEVVGNTSANQTATDLAAAWNASVHPYATGVTASSATDTVTLTADTAGVPFTVASSVTGGTGTIGAATTTTASAGPNDWSTAANWSEGAVPVSTDDVVFENSAVNVAWGLAQSGVTLDSLTIKRSYTGRIGLRQTEFATSANGETTTTAKPEYRQSYLDIGATRIDIGEHFGAGSPAGSSRIKIDNAKAGASDLAVHGTASTSAESGLPAVRYLAAHASANVFVRSAQGGVGIAVDAPGETSTVGTVSVSDTTTTSRVVVGDGATWTTWEQQGGQNAIKAAATVTSVTVDGGTLTVEGDYTITTMNANGGTVNDNHVKAAGNAITTLNIDGGTVNLQGSTEARTLATVNLNSGTLRGNAAVTITTLNEKAGEYQLVAS